MIEVQVSKDVEDCLYNIPDTLVCCYLRVADLKKAVAQRPEGTRPKIKANKAVPYNTIYYVNEAGEARKYLVVDEDISYE